MGLEKPKDLAQHEAIDQILNLDSVAVVEKLAGQEMTADTALEKLGAGLQLSKTAMLRKVMADTGDFMIYDVWSRRQNILEKNGFEPIYTYKWLAADQREHEYMVWIERKHGLVFTQEIATTPKSMGPEWRNFDHGKCYFCWRPFVQGIAVGLNVSGGWESQKRPNWRRSDDWTSPDDLYLRGYLTADGGLVHKLQNLLLKGEFFPQWPEWDDGKFPLASTFLTSEDYARHSHMEIEISARVSQARYDEMGEDLHAIMNIKPTWR